MKTRLDTAESTAAPNRPTLLSHARRRRRGAFTSVSVWLLGSVLATDITGFLLGGIHHLFQVAPEDLVLGVFNVVEIIFLDREHKDEHGGHRHTKTGHDGDPRQFHTSVPYVSSIVLRRL